MQKKSANSTVHLDIDENAKTDNSIKQKSNKNPSKGLAVWLIGIVILLFLKIEAGSSVFRNAEINDHILYDLIWEKPYLGHSLLNKLMISPSYSVDKKRNIVDLEGREVKKALVFNSPWDNEVSFLLYGKYERLVGYFTG